MSPGFSRRAFCCVLPAFVRAAEPLSVAPTESRKFRDSATEFELTRLTDPERSSSWLPRPPLRALSKQDTGLLYASDRSGSIQGWRMDLRTGESRQLTTATSLVVDTLSYGQNDRSIIYFDGPSLIWAQPKPRTVYKVDQGWAYAGRFALAEDGSYSAFAEGRNGTFRLRVAEMARGNVNTLLESTEPVNFIRFRPRRPGLLYGHSGNLALVGFDGRGDRHIKLAEGAVVDAQWSTDGRVAHYLLAPTASPKSIQLREYIQETGEDKLVAATTQFVTFARNGDSSVFAGISGNRGAPYILLLLRSGRRELTVAEHRASEPSKAAVLFSANSQRLYYQSDRHGRSCVYTIALERFIERTEVSAAATRGLLQPA